MTLPQDELTRTGLRLVAAHLAELSDPAFEMGDWIDRALCAGHQHDPDCPRVEEDWPKELQAVKEAVGLAVAVLQQRLARHAREQGLDWPQAGGETL